MGRIRSPYSSVKQYGKASHTGTILTNMESGEHSQITLIQDSRLIPLSIQLDKSVRYRMFMVSRNVQPKNIVITR